MADVEKSCTHIFESLKVLDIQKRIYAGGVNGGILEDHFMSIEQGLHLLMDFLELSENKDLKLRIQLLVSFVKETLCSLRNNQDDENLIMKLDSTYCELRKEMQYVVFRPGTNDCDTLFSENFCGGHYFNTIGYSILQTINILLTSRCKADQIAPVMKELEELRKKLTSLEPFFYVETITTPDGLTEKEIEQWVALTTFLDRATCLIYLSFVGNLNEDMLHSLRKNFSLLTEGTEIKEVLEMFSDSAMNDGLVPDASLSVLEDDINTSLSLLKRQEAYHISTTNEAVLKDHIMSLKHGIEFLKWLPKIYFDRDLDRRIMLLAGNVKQKLEWLTDKQGDENLNMDVNSVYADLREEMKNLMIKPSVDEDDTVSQEELIGKDHLRSNNDFLLEKITALITSNCKADQIGSLKKKLEDLSKMLTFLKPLDLFVDHNSLWFSDRSEIFATLLTIHQKATLVIYLSYVGKVDIERMILVAETDVYKMYITILNEDLLGELYLERELYLLENILLLVNSNINSLDDAGFELSEVLVDVHHFIVSLSDNVVLRKLHLLHRSFQAILGHSIPIICSCYLEHSEVDISSELDSVLDLIEQIKSEVQEIKLYYFPRVDDLGFLEYFSGYLKDLTKNQEISIKEDIDALHFEVQSLLSLAKVRSQEELNETPWTEVINMAYQAEYIIDLYLASGSGDVGLISSLSKIIEQLKNITVDVHGLYSTIVPAQDVALTSKSLVPGRTTQVSENDAIVGMQEEARIITEYLLQDKKDLNVISIVGMAGVGKTTLAHTVYKTLSLADHFDILARCTVSQSYKIRALLDKILDQVNKSNRNHRSISDDEELADHFCRSLKKRRYLIVLDDIWDTMFWNYLKRYLPDDLTGSRILITTRSREVADQIGSKVNELKLLSEENSWELFQKKLITKESLSDNLQKISKGIVEDCKGLPLSIVIIAGILSHVERTEKKWNEIAESVSSLILSDPLGECKAILELSYNHLSNHLKSCFLYLGSFPEDQKILVDVLIKLWIGEGFVRDTKSDSAEEVAIKYIDDLIVKSLVIPTEKSSGRGIKTLRLHDLLRDFCLDKAKEKHFFTMLDKRNHSWPLQDPRRLIINEFPVDYQRFSHHSIQSLICNDDLFRIINTRYCDMVLMQVLLVSELKSDEIPSLSRFVHLKYLALFFEDEQISILPLSISKLQNLQILIISNPYSIIHPYSNEMEVPDFIWDMVKLRHVQISPGASFQIDSNRLETSSFLLENLRSLCIARVSWDDSKWLSKLTQLQTLICVFVGDDLKVDNNTEEDDVTELDDGTKEDYVTEVDGVIEIGDVTEDEDNIEDCQFRMLSFNSRLTSLKVLNSAGTKQRFIRTCQLPISLQKLTLLEFYLKSNDISMIGRTLKHLEVFKMDSCHVPSGYEWNVDDDDFPKLKVLKLKRLELSKWNASEDSFPELEQLWVEYCNHLDEIPLDFGSLPKLRLITVRKCASSVDDSAREIEKQQHDEQNTEMQVRIHHNDW